MNEIHHQPSLCGKQHRIHHFFFQGSNLKGIIQSSVLLILCILCINWLFDSTLKYVQNPSTSVSALGHSLYRTFLLRGAIGNWSHHFHRFDPLYSVFLPTDMVIL